MTVLAIKSGKVCPHSLAVAEKCNQLKKFPYLVQEEEPHSYHHELRHL